MDYTWIKTTEAVYNTIWDAHDEIMIPYSSFSDPEGISEIGNGRYQMDTEWMLKGSCVPLLKRHTVEIGGERVDSYYIAIYKEE